MQPHIILVHLKLLFKSFHEFSLILLSFSKVSRLLEDVQIPIKCSFEFQGFDPNFSLHFVLHWVFFWMNVFLHGKCSYAIMTVLRILNKVYMSFFWPWRWFRWIEIKCFDLTRSQMPMLIPTYLFFRSLKLILWTVLICIVVPASVNCLIGHVGPWIKISGYSLQWGLWMRIFVFLFWIFGI